VSLPVPRCAVAARLRGDQLFATAPPASRWLLIEHLGPWQPGAFDTDQTLGAVARRAVQAGVRAQLIRRPVRRLRRSVLSWAYVDARPGREGAWWGTYRDERELLAVPLEPAGEPSLDPIYLVCAHGRRDACCAIWGRPAAAVLAVTRPAATWECSHVGGDRFAPNLVALPHGLYYGGAMPVDVLEIASAYEAGQVVPGLLRGRSSLAPPVQAAEHYARAAFGERGIDALAPLEIAAAGERTWLVRFRWSGGPLAVTVRAGVSRPELLTCSAGRPDSVRVFELVSLDLE
jgi:hypothetical protein